MTVPCDEGAETVAANLGNYPPAITFIAERQWGLKPEQAAHIRAGRNRITGQSRLAVAVCHRRNGLVHFDVDLRRFPYDLCPNAIGRLYRHWYDLNADHCLPKRVLRRMECHFGKTTIIFDATAEQVDEWREFLTALLSDAGSYLDIRQQHIGRDTLSDSAGRRVLRHKQ